MYDLDLDQMTSKLKYDLDQIKMHRHTKNEVSISTSNVMAQILPCNSMYFGACLVFFSMKTCHVFEDDGFAHTVMN